MRGLNLSCFSGIPVPLKRIGFDDAFFIHQIFNFKKMKNYEKPNYFNDYPTVHIDAIYKGKRLYDRISGKEVDIKDNSLVKLIILHKDILEKDLKESAPEKQTVLLAGQKLTFNLPNTLFKFTVELHEDLIFTKKSNKLPKAENCKCEVIIGFDRRKW